MRKLAAVLICKILCLIGHIIGKGSSLPGQVALKLYPNILSEIKLPETIIAVSGSNGKTSTTEMIAHILHSCGLRIAYNKEGANQTEGIATTVCRLCKLSGKLKYDVLLMECDESYAAAIFKHIKPTIFAVTNLYRDQLTRNHHFEYVCERLDKAVTVITEYNKNITLILNGDDPISSVLRKHCDAVYFGMNKNDLSVDKNKCGAYDDGNCPICKTHLTYEYRQFGCIGEYKCDNCGYNRPKTEYTITNVDMQDGTVELNNTYKIGITLKTMYNAYNVLAAFAVCSKAGIDGDRIASALNDYLLKSGRTFTFDINGRNGTFMTCKHENSTAYNQAISYLTRQNPCDFVIIVDEISRKYYTSDASWLWDIDFEKLIAENIKRVILVGKYKYHLALRMKYAGLENKTILTDFNEMIKTIDNSPDKSDIFISTCFSDKAKFLKELSNKK